MQLETAFKSEPRAAPTGGEKTIWNFIGARWGRGWRVTSDLCSTLDARWAPARRAKCTRAASTIATQSPSSPLRRPSLSSYLIRHTLHLCCYVNKKIEPNVINYQPPVFFIPFLLQFWNIQHRTEFYTLRIMKIQVIYGNVLFITAEN